MISGFSFAGATNSSFFFSAKTIGMPILPARKDEIESVLGRDGTYTFRGDYAERTISFDCELYSSLSFALRKVQIRAIAKWLSTDGELIIGYEANKKYTARISQETAQTMGTSTDKFRLDFVCQPVAEQVFKNDSLTFALATFPFSISDFPYGGYQTSYTISTFPTTISVMNAGNYKAYPIVKITPTAMTNITLTNTTLTDSNAFTLSQPTVSLYVDTKNKLVYSESGGVKTNKRSKFSGSYFYLESGINSITVSGNGTSAVVLFDFYNAYI